MSRFTYLLVDLSAIIVPFLFSFHPKIRFDKQWKAFLPALFLTATFFICWDVYFTSIGVWDFNKNYVTGIYIFNLPLEEILFFICIPYSCVFTYHCFQLWLGSKIQSASVWFSTVFIVFLLSVAVINHNHLYTLTAFTGLAILVFYNVFIRKSQWMKIFYLCFLVLLIPFFISNGILTGTGPDEAVVIYNNNENMGLRFFTIPFEDTFYGMFLILLNVTLYEFLLSKGLIKAGKVEGN